MVAEKKQTIGNRLMEIAKYGSLVILVIIIPLEILYQIILGVESAKLGMLYNALYYVYFLALIFVTIGYIIIGKTNKLHLLIYTPLLFLLLKGMFVLPEFILLSILDSFIYIIIITDLVFLLFCVILLKNSILGKPLREMGIIGIVRAVLSLFTFGIMLLYEDISTLFGWMMVVLIFLSIALSALFHYLQYNFFSRICSSKMHG